MYHNLLMEWAQLSYAQVLLKGKDSKSMKSFKNDATEN